MRAFVRVDAKDTSGSNHFSTICMVHARLPAKPRLKYVFSITIYDYHLFVKHAVR